MIEYLGENTFRIRAKDWVGNMREATLTVTSIDAEIMKVWIQDLRSGEFAQATGVLESERGFCCIGVLAYRQEFPYVKNATDILPDVFFEEVITTWSDNYYDWNLQQLLAAANDHGESFENIANCLQIILDNF